MAKVLTDLNVKELSGTNGLVVFFYPRANAGPCSIEVNVFNHKLPDIQALGYNVVGVSLDDVKTNEEFAKKEGLNYDLVADHDQKVTKKFNDLGAFDIDGKHIPIAERTTYILDKDGNIQVTLKDVQPITAATDVIKAIEGIKK
ncbi:peroxiredoxin [Mesoplasma lactucae]|uniref:thioredoxin-dependent peroxiredoxin n=1 Tax=Mesoplasma lactucae ATCC 49193 TaxID=81460 RepID=A0A291IRB9_9MOLU|nr:redoxin domain-containing protein [Mesoplasma lactucae]ATG97412.1 hypothetical protein CP520_01395 [Mesoplasma lactucae ATCC 49193]ATZ20135.1 peroxiredoxin [Mesoplasma lactucae ATCC 49193]MCL8216883.1 Peroxiredoxin Bcp [Mesoplasma lactucae ATCC 49193]